jgi:hypothetical protein
MSRRLEELEVQRGLKQVINGKYSLSIPHPTLLTPNQSRISSEYIATLYHIPYGAALSIGRHSLNNSGTNEFMRIRVIAYLDPDKKNYELLTVSTTCPVSVTATLQEFSKDLEREMAKVAEDWHLKDGTMRGTIGTKRKRRELSWEDDDAENGQNRKKRMRDLRD